MAHKSTGIDMEQNYVTVTLCVGLRLRRAFTSESRMHDSESLLAQDVKQLCVLRILLL